MNRSDATTYEADIARRAVAWTAVRGLGRNRTREECATEADALAIAAKHGDGRTMIYAITAEGRSAHIRNA